MRGGLTKMAEMVKRKLARKRGEEVQFAIRVSGEARRRANALRDHAIRITLRPATEIDVVRLAIARGLLEIEGPGTRWLHDAASGSTPDEQIAIRLDLGALERADAIFVRRNGRHFLSRSDVLRAALLVGLSSLERDAKEK